MDKLKQLQHWLIDKKEYGALFIRLAFGYHLIQYTYSEILFLEAGKGTAEWLAGMGVPFPKIAAYLAMGTEFFGGIFLILGLWIRPIAFLLTVNFIVAIYLVHIGDTYKNSFEAIQMLTVSLFFFFNGAGKPSLDNLLSKS